MSHLFEGVIPLHFIEIRAKSVLQQNLEGGADLCLFDFSFHPVERVFTFFIEPAVFRKVLRLPVKGRFSGIGVVKLYNSVFTYFV